MKPIVAAACAAVASATAVDTHGSAFLGRSQLAADPPSNDEIHAKWDKMDDFLGIMFTIACKSKHGKDVDGATAHAVKSGDIEYTDAMKFKKGLQKDNVQGLVQACGFAVANGKGKCRQGCADSYGKNMVQRNGCDGKCVESYDRFEGRCKAKAENLEKVYEMRVGAETARDTCYNGHCKEFPTVWMKASEADMVAEVTAQCGLRCTAEQIRSRCATKWTLQADFVRDSVRSTCAAESGSTKCFQTQKTAVSATYDTCSSTGKGTCDTQLAECQTKGNTAASHKEGGEFCAERQKLCLEQVDKNCLGDQKAALAKAQQTCEAETKTELDKCEDDTMTAKGTEAGAACEAELAPKCSKECSDKCQVPKLRPCLENLKSESDPAEEFCTDFWKLLSESSEVDPVTGDPIVLLSAKARAK